MTSLIGWRDQCFQILFVVAAAPLLAGWLQTVRALLQNRRSAGILQPYRDLFRLFHKETLIPEQSSGLFQFAP